MGSDIPNAGKGTSRELLTLAAPLILANSFATVQFTVDRAFLSQYDPDAMGASMPAAMVFWLFFTLIQGTAGYVSTFVAQYTGAGRPLRIGPAVWQGIYFSVVAGCVFWVLWPLAPYLFDTSITHHAPKLASLETAFFRSLCPAVLPMALIATLTGFFAGRGDTWTVLAINAFGTFGTVFFDYAMIFGHFGFPQLGIVGAGWATAIGSWMSASLAMLLFFQTKYRIEFATVSGWRIDIDLMKRLLKFGGPAGLQWALDALSFTLFIMFVGRLGDAEANATSLTFTLNMVGFLPMQGIGQTIAILVGQRLGENRPDLAERSTILGARWTVGYMVTVALIYVLFPNTLMWGFRPPDGSESLEEWKKVVAIVPTLLICVAAYSLADSLNVTYSFALRGAGDTRYVTILTFALAWPCMIIPTYLLVTYGGNIYWAWSFASFYISVMAFCFWLRFRSGKWKSMRVIEAAPI